MLRLKPQQGFRGKEITIRTCDNTRRPLLHHDGSKVPAAMFKAIAIETVVNTVAIEFSNANQIRQVVSQPSCQQDFLCGPLLSGRRSESRTMGRGRTQ